MRQGVTNSNHEAVQLLVASLTQIIGCLDGTNHQVVQLLLRSENDISLLKLLRDYLICTPKTLDFLTDLHAWLSSALIPRLNRLTSALTQLRSDESKMVYVQTADLKTALDDFHTAPDTLSFEHLSAVLDDQRSLSDRLYATNQTVNREKIHVYQMVMAATALASVFMVVFAAMTSPVLVAVSMAALAGWAYMLVKCEDKAKTVRGIMESDTWMVLVDLEGIQIMVQDLLNRIRRLDVDIAPVVNVRKGAVVSTMIKDMEKKIQEFAEAVRLLESKRKKCYNGVNYTRDKIVGTIFR